MQYELEESCLPFFLNDHLLHDFLAVPFVLLQELVDLCNHLSIFGLIRVITILFNLRYNKRSTVSEHYVHICIKPRSVMSLVGICFKSIFQLLLTSIIATLGNIACDKEVVFLYLTPRDVSRRVVLKELSLKVLLGQPFCIDVIQHPRHMDFVENLNNIHRRLTSHRRKIGFFYDILFVSNSSKNATSDLCQIRVISICFDLSNCIFTRRCNCSNRSIAAISVSCAAVPFLAMFAIRTLCFSS